MKRRTPMPPPKQQETGLLPTLPVVGVGVAVFKDDAVLLVKRARPPSADQWALPGGKVRLGESLQQAAEREVAEETGLRIEAGRPVFAFDLIEHDPDGRCRWHYVVVDVEAEYVSGEPVAADDAAAVRWVRAQELTELPVNATTRRLLREVYGFGGG